MSALAKNAAADAYLLAQNPTERERLRIQAEAWKPATERLLDAIGVEPDWQCLDLGCGAPGALGSLARRIGPNGRVTGLDNDPRLIAEAAEWLREQRLAKEAADKIAADGVIPPEPSTGRVKKSK